MPPTIVEQLCTWQIGVFPETPFYKVEWGWVQCNETGELNERDVF